MAVNANLEHTHEDVYGKSFALYSRADMLEFIEPFAIRFERNKFDRNAIFSGKKCLDAGCGNGRGSIFMSAGAAASIDCLDISPTNIASTANQLKSFGFDNFKTHLSSIESLPFPDDTFDFVWCNGVIMHAAEPDACLKELIRVTKRGGKIWLYVYGRGGLYWWVIHRFRKIMRNVEPSAAIAALQLMRYSVRYIAEYLDDWKVSYLRAYSIEDMASRLKELGVDGEMPLKYGVDYDTSHRRTMNPDEVPWMGDGDLRYLLTKTGAPSGDKHKIGNGEYGSAPNFAPEIAQRFGGYFDELERLVAANDLLAIAACANIQRNLRDLMSVPRRLNIDAFEEAVRNAVANLRALT